MPELEKLRGKFIVLDGPDGAGKSTQQRLLGAALNQAGIPAVLCRDPGGTVIGDRIRQLLLHQELLPQMDVHCETMLFMASRAQLVKEVIRPALQGRRAVVCDRFVTSTYAYQGAAGYDPKRVIELARYAFDDLWPDVTVILDIDPEAGFVRTGRTSGQAGKNRKAGSEALFEGALVDAMEARPLEFHRNVRELFLAVARDYPGPVVTVSAADDEQTVHRNTLEAILRVLS